MNLDLAFRGGFKLISKTALEDSNCIKKMIYNNYLWVEELRDSASQDGQILHYKQSSLQYANIK